MDRERLALGRRAASGLCLAALAAAWPVAARPLDAAPRGVAPAAAPARPPLAFEANAGQTDASVRFLARGAGYRLFLTAGGAVLALEGPRPHAVRLRFGGAAARVSGAEPLAARSNYLLGPDPARWRTNVETFGRVRVEGAFAGVDVVFYGRDGALEYDLVVAPGADPAAVRVAVEGADRLSVDARGDLEIHTPGGVLTQRRPVAYQEVDGRRAPVAARYDLGPNGAVGFALGAYDPARPLVVDPVLSYSTYLAGSGDESGAGITVDAAGNAYVTGGTTSLDFPTTPGAYAPSSAGQADGFLAKLNPEGTGYLFSTYLGGSGDDGISRAAVDAAGNVYVAGGTGSTNFPTTAGAFQTAPQGSFDGFVAKLSADGASLLYATYLGGSGDDGASGIAVDAAGSAYVTGASTSSNYPTTPGAFDTSNTSLIGLPDAVVTKLDAAGSGLVYSTYLGGAFNLDGGAAIAVDAAGAAYVAGATNGGFPTTSGAFDTSFNGGGFDGFVTKLNATGTGLAYSTYLGGGGEDYAFGLAIDAGGNAYLTGFTDSTSFPVAGGFQPSNAGGFDAYVTKLAASGASLVYSSYLGGSGDEGLTSNLGTELQIAGAVAVDAAGNAYLTGFTDSVDFPVVGAFQPAKSGGFDAWVAKVNPGGTALAYASYLGGAGEERGLGIAADAAGAAYVTGFTLSAGFPTTAGVAAPAGGGNLLTDGFVAKIGSGPGDTPGVYVASNGAWFVRTSNAGGAASTVFFFGPGGAGIVPVAGDWDGNGTDTAGIYDSATGAFFLTSSNRPGAADVVLLFGSGGAVPIAGDWDGDGTDTVGIYVPASGAFFLRNSNTNGPADIAFFYGPAAADVVPVAGDWDGDGVDTVGIYDRTNGFFFLTNENAGGPADLTFSFGPADPTIEPLAGDWNADGTDTVGIYATTTGAWFLTDANASGPANVVFFYGSPGLTPLTGHWGG